MAFAGSEHDPQGMPAPQSDGGDVNEVQPGVRLLAHHREPQKNGFLGVSASRRCLCRISGGLGFDLANLL